MNCGLWLGLDLVDAVADLDADVVDEEVVVILVEGVVGVICQAEEEDQEGLDEAGVADMGFVVAKARRV